MRCDPQERQDWAQSLDWMTAVVRHCSASGSLAMGDDAAQPASVLAVHSPVSTYALIMQHLVVVVRAVVMSDHATHKHTHPLPLMQCSIVITIVVSRLLHFSVVSGSRRGNGSGGSTKAGSSPPSVLCAVCALPLPLLPLRPLQLQITLANQIYHSYPGYNRNASEFPNVEIVKQTCAISISISIL